jgi:hypothetical protein
MKNDEEEIKMKVQSIGITAIILGAIGIVIPILVLAGNSQPVVQLGVMISGAIVLGCGVIATTIGLKK